MTPEEAYKEALRRIREAEKTEAVELDLSLSALKRLPQELGATHRAPIAQPLLPSAATWPATSVQSQPILIIVKMVKMIYSRSSP
jgi:hypothetical protein